MATTDRRQTFADYAGAGPSRSRPNEVKAARRRTLVDSVRTHERDLDLSLDVNTDAFTTSRRSTYNHNQNYTRMPASRQPKTTTKQHLASTREDYHVKPFRGVSRQPI